jgi:hypothetical protein
MGTLDHNFGLCEGHFVGKTTMKKILQGEYHWPTFFKCGGEF